MSSNVVCLILSRYPRKQEFEESEFENVNKKTPYTIDAFGPVHGGKPSRYIGGLAYR